ncbi:MAG TPA: hypothetical protein VKA12_07125 [Roseiarcus sp.]|nr:hypothetical protein [Roseiarcus sp.]
MSLADKFAVVVVNEFVDHADSSVATAGVARLRAGADIDDDRRAVADDDWLGGPSRNWNAFPTAPAPTADEKLIAVKGAKAIEAVETVAVKLVGAETIEAETVKVEAPVEPARREMRKMTDSKSWVSE